MKKILSLATLTLLISLAQVGFAFSAPSPGFDPLGNPCASAPNSTVCKASGTTQTQDDNSVFGKNGIINKATNVIVVVVGIAGVIMVIVGGIQYSLSSGDPQRVNSAKDTIIFALVGMVIAVIAKTIITFVISKL